MTAGERGHGRKQRGGGGRKTGNSSTHRHTKMASKETGKHKSRHARVRRRRQAGTGESHPHWSQASNQDSSNSTDRTRASLLFVYLSLHVQHSLTTRLHRCCSVTVRIYDLEGYITAREGEGNVTHLRDSTHSSLPLYPSVHAKPHHLWRCWHSWRLTHIMCTSSRWKNQVATKRRHFSNSHPSTLGLLITFLTPGLTTFPEGTCLTL